jgi:site-specific recombinase XerD
MREEHIEIYLTKKVSSQKIKFNTVRSYRATLKSWISYSKGDDSKAKQYLQSMLTKKKPTSISGSLFILSDAYEILKIKPNPFYYLSRKFNRSLGIYQKKHARRYEISKKESTFKQDAFRIISPAKNHVSTTEYSLQELFLKSRNNLIYQLLFHYQLRLSEIVAINLADLDLKAQTIRKLFPFHSFRPIDLSYISQELDLYLKYRKAFCIIDNPALFLSKGGLKRLRDVAARRATNKMIQLMNLYSKGKSIKHLRSANKSSLPSNGIELSALARLLCKDVSEMLKTYLSLYENSSEEI